MYSARFSRSTFVPFVDQPLTAVSFRFTGLLPGR